MNICLFCDQSIPNHMFTCSKHYHLYRTYKNEEWCKELLRMQARDLRIAKRESMSISDITNLDAIALQIPFGRKEVSLMRIRELQKQGLKQKKIAEILGCSVAAIKMKLYREKQKSTRSHISD